MTLRTRSVAHYTGHFVFAALLGGFIVLLSMKIPAESDFFQHLTHGDDFLANPVLHAHDHWSYTGHGGYWVRWTFLYSLLLSLVYAILKIPGIWLLQMTALLMLAVLLWKFRRKTGLNCAELALVVALVFAAMQFRFNFRAENFAYIFFAITLRWLFMALTTGSTPGLKFVVFLAFWQFFQNSAYLGLVPFAAYAGLRYWRTRDHGVWIFFFFALCALAFAHIDTYHLHIRFWQGYEFHRYFSVEELSPPLKREHIFFWLALCVALLGFFHSLREWQKRASIRPGFFFQLSCFLFFALAACKAARAIPFALIAGMPFILRGAGIIFRSAKELRLPYTALGIGLFAYAFSIFGYTEIAPGTRLSDRYHPEKVCDFILREKPPGNMLHPIFSAGYFLWRFRGNPPVMIDYRLELYLDFIREFRDAKTGAVASGKFIRKYGITYAVESRHEPRNPAFQAWKLVYRDEGHEIRMNPACNECADFLRRHEIQEPAIK